MSTEIYSSDFDAIKENIKDYFKNHTDFTDYNFEGSSLSQLMNVLAYITQYQIFFLNMSVNEMMMPTALQRKQVFTLANQLNYVVTRMTAPYIEVVIGSDTTFSIPAYSAFTVGGVTCYNKSIININADSVNALLYEGELVTFTATSDGSTNQIYELADGDQIDNSSLRVFIDSFNGTDWDESSEEWICANTGIFEIGDKAYYIKYDGDNVYIKFDSGNLFSVPESNSRIRVVYLKTNGTLKNGVTGTGTLPTLPVGNHTITVPDTSMFAGGSDEESIEDIKQRSVIFYSSQNRAVTEKDYYSLFNRLPEKNAYKDVSIWGGEKDFEDLNSKIVLFSDYKRVGRVRITCIKEDDDLNNTFLTDTEITAVKDHFENFKFHAVEIEYVHQNILTIYPTISLKVNGNYSVNLTDTENKIKEYLTQFNGFNSQFNPSDFIGYIESLSEIDSVFNIALDNTSQIRVKTDDISIGASGINKEIHLGTPLINDTTAIAFTVGGETYTSDGFGAIKNTSDVQFGEYSAETGTIILYNTIPIVSATDPFFDILVRFDFSTYGVGNILGLRVKPIKNTYINFTTYFNWV